MIDPNGASLGTATVNVYDVAPDVTGALTVNGSAVPVAIVDPGQNGLFTFTGAAGQQVTVRMTGNTMGGPAIRLLRPNLTQQGVASSALTNFNMTTQTLATDGVYTVVVDPASITVGGINVAVTSP